MHRCLQMIVTRSSFIDKSYLNEKRKKMNKHSNELRRVFFCHSFFYSPSVHLMKDNTLTDNYFSRFVAVEKKTKKRERERDMYRCNMISAISIR